MIIYLNGTSSSGKTQIATELQKLIDKPVFYFSIDTLLYSLSEETLNAVKGKCEYKFTINWQSVFSGYFECISSLHNTGNDVICDCPVYSLKQKDFFDKSLGDIEKIITIGINCPLEVLKQREEDRDDRAIGLAERQFKTIHDFLTYDFEVDSSLYGPEELAQIIFEQI